MSAAISNTRGKSSVNAPPDTPAVMLEIPLDTLTFAAPYELKSGDGCKVNALFGVAEYPASPGVLVELVTVGVFRFPRAGAALEPGAAVYWDDTAKVATGTATGNLKIGVATIAAPADSPTAEVRLNGSF